MFECGSRARFADETLAPIAIGHQLGRQDFERDVAIETGVGGAIDDAHPASADLFDNFVM
jgi:hypothetical protein